MEVNFVGLDLQDKKDALQLVEELSPNYHWDDIAVSFNSNEQRPKCTPGQIIISGPFQTKQLENYVDFGVALTERFSVSRLHFVEGAKEVSVAQMDLALMRKYKREALTEEDGQGVESELKQKITQAIRKQEMTVTRFYDRKKPDINVMRVTL